jgi:hypothetical protein
MSPLEQDAMLWTMATSAPPLETRTRRCYVNFQFTMNTRFGQSHRRSALAEIPRELLELEPEPTDRATTWMHQRQFAFVVCPYGNGLDTHRVWEALALGCIAIVKPGPFASMYQGLRVLCVRRWSDVTPELLDQAAESFARVGAGLLENGFDSIKVASPLSLRFWTDKFREAGNAAVDEAVGGGWFG